MRLLLHDTLATAPITFPLAEGWLESAFSFEVRPDLRAADVGAADLAFVPSAEIAILHDTHVVLPDIAVIAEQIGFVAMRTPLRPDEVGPTPVRLWNVSGSAEVLARATIQPFYGIVPTEWTSDDNAQATVVVVEGAPAIQSPEAGFAEDLVRAWFILAGQPFVSHLLVAPKEFSRDDAEPVTSALTKAGDLAHERRRDLRRALAERHDLDRDHLAAVHNAQRYRIDEEDRRALIMLLQRGNKGSAYPYPWDVPFLD
ncbi:MAG: MqnA/MqnD/SBP family protein [Thermomicrobiales bacterium]